MTYEMIPELTPEMAADTAKKFDVPVEEVYRQWEETKKLNEQGGTDAIMASMGEALVATEEAVVSMVSMAAEYLDPAKNRFVCLGELLQANLNRIDPNELDNDTLLHALTIATYRLAEADQRIGVLLDGAHRQKGT